MSPDTTTQTILPSELNDKQRNGISVNLIDVRTPVEYREVHVPFARNVPLDQLNPTEVLAGHAPDEPLYVICRSGSRAAKACEQIRSAGYHNVVNVEGGTSAWEAAGLTVIRGKKTVSLERQVRIAAGLLVLVGALLAFFVQIHFVWLAAFIGAGLTFSGLTDTCGMGMVLARMPWNQVKSSSTSGECETPSGSSSGTCSA